MPGTPVQIPDLPDCIAAWNAINSSPAYNATTGEMTSAGEELTGSGATLAIIGNPRFSTIGLGDDAKSAGMLCRGQYDIATANRGEGIEITLPAPPAGSWNHRRVMGFIVYTPTNMGGDYVNTIARLITTNNASTVISLNKVHAIPTASDVGKAQHNASGGTQTTVTKNGVERQVLAFYNTSATNQGRGYVNVAGSASPLASNDANTFTKINIGFLDGAGATKTNNPAHGVIHAVYLYAYDSTSASNFTPTQVADGLAYLTNLWECDIAQTDVVSICGDSISYPSATQQDTTLNSAASGVAQTTTTASSAVGATSLALTNRTGFSSGRFIIEPGTSLAEPVNITSGVLTGAGNITCSALKYAHASGVNICNSTYGWVNPYGGWPMKSKMFGHGRGVKLFNHGNPSSQLSQVQAAKAQDGSTLSMDSVSGGKRTIIIQRGTNDLNGGASAATLLGYAETYAGNARALATPPDRILVGEVLKRFGSGASTTDYNAAIAASEVFDGVVRFAQHPLLNNPENPENITYSGATALTTFLGVLWDGSGVHPRAFGQACMALMVDQAYADVWGLALPYAPAISGILATQVGGSVVLRWDAPTEVGAPNHLGGNGPSFLVVKIRRAGTLIATIAPASINFNTGVATYTTTYTDTDNQSGRPYTFEVVDGASNSSGQVPVTVDNSGARFSRFGLRYPRFGGRI